MENKDKLMMLPIIHQHVQHGTTINSDGAKVYKGLIHMGFIHKTVIHRRKFVARDGTHTNYIEIVWSYPKAHLKSIHGSQGEMLDSNVDEFVYQYNRKNEGKIFNLMLIDIATYYPALKFLKKVYMFMSVLLHVVNTCTTV